jgi:hypothetical protein
MSEGFSAFVQQGISTASGGRPSDMDSGDGGSDWRPLRLYRRLPADANTRTMLLCRFSGAARTSPFDIADAEYMSTQELGEAVSKQSDWAHVYSEDTPSDPDYFMLGYGKFVAEEDVTADYYVNMHNLDGTGCLSFVEALGIPREPERASLAAFDAQARLLTNNCWQRIYNEVDRTMLAGAHERLCAVGEAGPRSVAVARDSQRTVSGDGGGVVALSAPRTHRSQRPPSASRR